MSSYKSCAPVFLAGLTLGCTFAYVESLNATFEKAQIRRLLDHETENTKYWQNEYSQLRKEYNQKYD